MPTESNSNKQPQFKTDGGKTKSNAIDVPSIALPKGGGAIKGIDQKFTVNAVNGTAAFSIPLPVSAARGVSPNLSLSYNSGAGNGIFGLGWNLSLPTIKRKTDKELPQYNDAADSDTYVLSDAEDLVPEFKKEPDGSFSTSGGEYVINEDTTSHSGWVIRFYKPRIEGLFARIERWTAVATGEIKWRIISKDNMTTLYGWSADSRLADPADNLRVFEWFPEHIYDDKGNCALYNYFSENSTGLNLSEPHNRNRYKNGAITYANLYPKMVSYGNYNPYYAGDDFLVPGNFMFHTAFDYGQYDINAPYDNTGTWTFRSDAFSEYKAGFEIRTTRLCRRVLLIHTFTSLIGKTALVKSLDLTYGTNGNAGFTFLTAATSTGYIKYATDTYSSKSLPAMEFTYAAHQWNSTVKEITAADLHDAPIGLHAPYQFTDLYNEGLPGLLIEQGNAWYYKRNSGNGNFGLARKISPKPSFTGLGSRLQLVDLDGDGSKQLANFSSNPQGYYEINDDEQWQKFKSFKTVPNIDLSDPNIRLLDLNGDGKTDALLTEDTVLTWYESAGREGFADYHRRPKAVEEEDGPTVIFNDSTQSIFLADMSGDGLVDIVRIRNGEVCYWPNLGYSNFGAKITMDNSPVFDTDDAFNPAYIKIADIDGSGTPDIIYLGKNKFTCWLNFSGNSYSTTPFEISGFPAIHPDADITVTDLLGNGLACIVWSSTLQKDALAPLKYIDLMNSKKPHILTKQINNLGMEVEMEYTPSTKYYLDDKLAGTPWVTRLHFPVYCVSKVTSTDKITGHTFISNYTYHHGYYDHAEKEFRGFGRVDQTDTDSADNWVMDENDSRYIVEAALNQAPVLTRSWFHTGAFTRNPLILGQFEQEYWYHAFGIFSPEYDLPAARIIPDNAINAACVANLSFIEQQEAMRACKSMLLRTEVFAKDAPSDPTLELTPYTVGTHNCMIELLQPKGKNRHAVFCVKESEAITYNYERNISDPRIAHTLNLSVDEYGNVLKSASVVYGRTIIDYDLPQITQDAQARINSVYTENTFTNDINTADSYRLRVPCETKTYEVTGLGMSGSIYTLADFDNLIYALEIAYEQEPGGASEIRKIEHVQSLFYDTTDVLSPLALGTIDSLGLPYENYQLAYTKNNLSNLVDDIFNQSDTRVTNAELTDGKYLRIDDDWWVRSGIVNYIDGGLETPYDATQRFYKPIGFTGPYGSQTLVYYDNFFIYINQTVDAVANTSSVVTFDYRTMTPVKMQDANDNLSEVLLDELGLPKAMAVYGKGTEADYLTGLTAHTLSAEQSDIDSYFSTASVVPTDSDVLETQANGLLQQATARFVYDFNSYVNSGGISPAVVATIMREEHYEDNAASLLQLSFEYSGGFGNVVMKKVQAEGGYAKQVTITGTHITVDNVYVKSGLRWIGNGRTVLNNKGNVVKQYEPYFSVTAGYESIKEMVEQGVTPILQYDAPGRLIRTDFPDGTFTTTTYSAWKQIEADQNDTSANSDWYQFMSNGTTQQMDAADKAAAHFETYKTVHVDSLGRPVLSEEKDENGTVYYTTLVLDIENNLRAVIDARNITTMQYKYDMLGNMVYQESTDSGRRWLFHNAIGSPLRTWDERDFRLEFTYDRIHRPLLVTVNGGPDGLNNVVDKYIYGEQQHNDKIKNLRGNLYQHYDTGGLQETPEYYFSYKPIQINRRLAADYKSIVDWSSSGNLESTVFTISTVYDAMGRIKQQTAPDGSSITPSYNRRGLLTEETVDQSGALTSPLIEILYDAKGQRTRVMHGNHVFSDYTYDEKTFRLNRLYTEDDNGKILQDLNYTYDAVGNITWKTDDMVPDSFYNNSLITGNNQYTYDALYRLTEATGRENQAAISFNASDNWDDAPYRLQQNPNDSMVMQNYTQSYEYDKTGNILELRHMANTGSYTRDYDYENGNNRISHIGVDQGYDYYYSHHAQHGYIESMPHLTVLNWNFKEEIVATSTQSVGGGDVPETTYYQYDSTGKRLRKITEEYAPAGYTPAQKQSRIYIEGYEYYEDFNSGDSTETLSLIDEGRRFVMFENSTAYGSLVRYQHPDHQGSTSLETDENGDIISYEEYHPFGTTAYQAMNAGINASAKRYRYTGMERDEETGLSYHNARYYIPWLGRWMNCDPIGIGDGVNVYVYCHNNPVNGTDTSGTQTDLRTANTSLYTPQSTQAPKESGINPALLQQSMANMANRQTPTLAATGGGSGSNASSAGVTQYSKGTNSIQSNLSTAKSFKELGLVTEKPETSNPNAVREAGKAKLVGALLTGVLAIATGGSSLFLTAAATIFAADQAIAGLHQMSTNLETKTLFERGASKGFQNVFNAKKENADLYASIFHTGTELALGGSGVFKAGNLAIKADKQVETFYRAMSNSEFGTLEANKGLSSIAGKELFVSTKASYSRAYLQKPGYDVLVEFNMKQGATKYFNDVSVFHRTAEASSGWASRGKLLWKSEGGVMNLGIQQNTHMFNDWIKDFKTIK